MNAYQKFIQAKRRLHQPSGFDPVAPLPKILFEFQRKIVIRSLKLGRSAIFAECGLGKTLMQLAWANQVWAKTAKPVLIIAPLVVSEQTSREALKCHYTCRRIKEPSDIKVKHGIYITNYERADRFDASQFGGVVLDESSILKSTDGKTRTSLIEQFGNTPYRLACTATPAPNDTMELGNHAQFLGVMSQVEMLSMYFVHDGGETQKWRLKKHARGDFWKWVGTWATVARNPSDMGCDHSGYDLPPLVMKEIVVESSPPDGYLIALPASTLGERLSAYRNSMDQRIDAVLKLVNGNNDQWIVWCRMNEESERLSKLIDRAIEITGSDEDEDKASRLLEFIDGKHRVLVTKSKIAGFGANLQNCSKMVFAGVTDSFEQYYQTVRRCWRFGQDKPVQVFVVGSEAETAVFQNLKRKQADAARMTDEMVKAIKGQQ